MHTVQILLTNNTGLIWVILTKYNQLFLFYYQPLAVSTAVVTLASGGVGKQDKHAVHYSQYARDSLTTIPTLKKKIGGTSRGLGAKNQKNLCDWQLYAKVSQSIRWEFVY